MRSFYNGIHFKTYGDKKNPPVIFLHGFMGYAGDWHEIINKLCNNFYCVAIDLPGHGKSLKIEEDDWTFDGLAIRLNEIAHVLLIKNITVVGYSMGGRIALFWAVKYRQIISRLVLESASPGIESDTERYDRLKSDQILADRIKTSVLKDYVMSWYELPLFGKTKDHPLFPSLLQKRIRNNPAMLAKSLLAFSQGRQPSLWQNLSSIKQKVLLVNGEDDIKYMRINEKMKEYNPEFVISGIKQCAHNVHFEKVHEFAEHLKQFLSLNIQKIL
jgi:2-succinyl-6-hydroxy-2,4-cyclohexadiene-1-carboxylate synthase